MTNQVERFIVRSLKDIFPQTIRYFIETVCKSSNFDEDFVSVGVLAAASIAIGKNAYFKYDETSKVNDPSLFICCVGRKGAGKTPSVRYGLEPIFNINERYEDEYAAAYNDYKNALIDFQTSTRNDVPKPEKPKSKKLVTSNCTVEKLIQLLEGNENGMLYDADEIITWFDNFTSYKTTSDRGYWINIADNRSFSIDRKVSESNRAKTPFVTVVGGIQNDLLSKIVTNDNNASGLLDRFLYVVKENLPYSSRKSNHEANIGFINQYNKLIEGIFKFFNTYESNGADEGSKPCKIYRFANEKQKELYDDFTDKYNKLEREQYSYNQQLAESWSKYQTITLKLFVILSVLHSADYHYRNNNTIYVEPYLHDDIIPLAMAAMNYFELQYAKIQAIASISHFDIYKEPTTFQKFYTTIEEIIQKKVFELLKEKGVQELDERSLDDLTIEMIEACKQFTRKDVTNWVQELELNSRTIDRYLSKDKYFSKVKYNCYKLKT